MSHNNKVQLATMEDKVDSTSQDKKKYLQLLPVCSMHHADGNSDFPADQSTAHLRDGGFIQEDAGVLLTPVLAKVPAPLLSQTGKSHLQPGCPHCWAIPPHLEARIPLGHALFVLGHNCY